MKKIVLTFALFLIVALVPLQHVFAQTAQGPACVSNGESAQLCNPIGYAAEWKTFIFRAIQILTGFFLLTPVLRIAFAGFLMVTSQGNEESLTAGKRAIQWSVMSIVLAMFAFVIIQALGNYLGVQDRSGSAAGNNPVLNPIATNDFGGLLVQMLVGFLGVAGLFAVFMVIIGGYKYITAGGNEEQATSAKATLQWAIIGVAVILLSYVIVRGTLTFFAG